jgi:hypothetical protein
VESIQSKEEFIHNKMDHSKTTMPRFQVKNKLDVGLNQLMITFTRMIVDGHRDEVFAQYSKEFWPNEFDFNFTIGFLLHLFKSLDKELVCESQKLLIMSYKMNYLNN